MKIRCFFGLMLFMQWALGSFTSCTKDKASSSSPPDTITSHVYSPSLQIASCGGNKYLLDLDFDGVPDIEVGMNCSLDQQTVPAAGCFYFTSSINVNVDTIFNSNILLSQYRNLYYYGYILYGYNLKDSISSLSSYNATTPICAMSYYQNITPWLTLIIITLIFPPQEASISAFGKLYLMAMSMVGLLYILTTTLIYI